MTVTYMFRATRRDAPEQPEEDPTVAGEAPDASASAAETLDAPVDRISPSAEPVPAPDAADNQDIPAQTATPIAADSGRFSGLLPVKWSPPTSQLILVGKSRGGAGATSVAVNLALELLNARRRLRGKRTRRVALVDLDVQFGNVGSFLDLEDRGGMLELLRLKSEPDAQAVRNSMLQHPSGLRVLAAPSSAIPLEALDIERIELVLTALMSENDYVVVDLPPALVGWLEPLLARATRLLMVSDLSVPSIACARRIIGMMKEDNHDLSVDIVLSREKKPLIPHKIHRQASAALGRPLSHWLPDEPKLSRLALDRGEPLAMFAPRCPWTKAVRQIAASLDAARLSVTKT